MRTLVGLIVTFTILIQFTFCTSNPDARNENGVVSKEGVTEQSNGVAKIEFLNDFYDFGTIKHGEVLSYSFTFENTGTAPLIVFSVVAGCGCTKTTVSNDVLKPKEKATVEVVFDSKGWYGSQFKSVTLVTNAETPKRSVTIKANVVK